MYNYLALVIQSMDTEIDVYLDSNVQKLDLLVIGHLNVCSIVHYNHNNMNINIIRNVMCISVPKHIKKCLLQCPDRIYANSISR